jgi:hypothetical protein
MEITLFSEEILSQILEKTIYGNVQNLIPGLWIVCKKFMKYYVSHPKISKNVPSCVTCYTNTSKSFSFNSVCLMCVHEAKQAKCPKCGIFVMTNKFLVKSGEIYACNKCFSSDLKNQIIGLPDNWPKKEACITCGEQTKIPDSPLPVSTYCVKCLDVSMEQMLYPNDFPFLLGN